MRKLDSRERSRVHRRPVWPLTWDEKTRIYLKEFMLAHSVTISVTRRRRSIVLLEPSGTWYLPNKRQRATILGAHRGYFLKSEFRFRCLHQRVSINAGFHSSFIRSARGYEAALEALRGYLDRAMLRLVHGRFSWNKLEAIDLVYEELCFLLSDAAASLCPQLFKKMLKPAATAQLSHMSYPLRPPIT